MSRFVLTAQLNIQAPSNVNQVVRQIQSQLDNVRVNIQVNNAARARSEIDQLTQSTDRATVASERLGRTFVTSVRRFSALAVATRAVSLFTNTISSAVDEAIKFERELVRISQVTGKTITQLSSLSETITSLATNLGVSSSSLINVSTILAQAGLTAKDTEIALRTLAQTQLSPTFDDITETTEGAVAIFNQFRAGAAALEQQLGSVNAVSAAFAVESSDLIDVVRRTGGVFKSSGGSLNELLALFTSVRATTRESAESIGTGLRTIFTRIQRPKTIEFLKQFGVELVDLQGKFVGPFEAIKRLSEALGGLEQGDITFIRVAEELGGFRQIGKVIPLLQQFAVAQEALNVAQEGAGSLANDVATAQQSLAIRIIKVKEEFLALIRSITQTGTFQVLADTTLKLASALIKLADSLKPVIPLLLTFASIKAAQGIGGFLGGISAGLGGGGGGRRMSRGGQVHYFARGGMVPGSGNRDTVPAMLQPGEFVIRKSSVNRLGASNLAAMNENRFQKGGKQGTRKNLQEKLESDGVSSTFKINDQQIQAVIRAAGDKDPQDKELDIGGVFLQPEGIMRKTVAGIDKSGINSMLNSVTSGLGKSATKTLTQELIGKFNSVSIGITSGSLSKTVSEQYKNGINTALANFSNTFASQTFKNNPPFDSGKFSAALNRANIEQIEGGIFEAFVNGLSNSPFTENKINPNDTFDFPSGLGSAGQIFNLDSSLISDAKRTFSEDSLGSLAKKGTNKLVEGFRSTLANELISQNVGGFTSDIENRKKASTAEQRVSARKQKKFLGGIIRKFAAGGLATAPMVDDILQASGSILPNPSSAIQALIKSGGGAVDIDRTLKRTVGDLAYAKAKTPEAKQSVLQTYFRDEAKRLQDLKSSPLTQFGKELQAIIKSGQIDPRKISIISKSKRVKGAAEYLGGLFGIPTANMIFTQGASKQPALDSMRSKGPRADRSVKRFATGGNVGTDTVPALLTPGEFVINKQSAQNIGYGSLNRMNKVGKYAKGGIVGVQRFANGGKSKPPQFLGSGSEGFVDFDPSIFTGVSTTFKVLDKVTKNLSSRIANFAGFNQELSSGYASLSQQIKGVIGFSGGPLITALKDNAAANKLGSLTQFGIIDEISQYISSLDGNTAQHVIVQERLEAYGRALLEDTKVKQESAKTSKDVTKSPVSSSGEVDRNIDQEIANVKQRILSATNKELAYNTSTEQLARRGITATDAIQKERERLKEAIKAQAQAAFDQARKTIRSGASASRIDVRTGKEMSDKTAAAKAKKQQLQEAGFTKGGEKTEAILRGRRLATDPEYRARVESRDVGGGGFREERSRQEILERRATITRAERSARSDLRNTVQGASSPLPSNRASDAGNRGGAGGGGGGGGGGTPRRGGGDGMAAFAAFSAVTSALAMLAPTIDENSTSMDYFKKNISELGLQFSTVAFLLQQIPLGGIVDGFKGLLVNVGLMSSAAKVNAAANTANTITEGAETGANTANTASEVAETSANLAAVLANPFVLLAAAVLGAIGAFALWQSSIAEAAKAQKEKAIKEGDVNTAVLKAEEEVGAKERMVRPTGDELGNVGLGAASGAAIGLAVGSIVPVIGTTIGAAAGAIIGAGVGAMTASLEVDGDIIIKHAKAMALTNKATEKFQDAQDATSQKMEEFRNGTASAIDVLNAASSAQLAAVEARMANEEALSALQKELAEDTFSYMREALAWLSFGFVDSNAEVKQQKVQKQEELQKANKELDKTVLASAKPGIGLIQRQTANSGGSFQDVLNLLKQRDAEQGTNVVATLEREQDEAKAKGRDSELQRMEKEFNNLAKEAQRTREAFNAMNLGFNNVNAAASAASVGINNLIEAQDGSTSRLGQTISTLEAGITNAAQGISDTDWNSAVQEASGQLSKLGGDPAQIKKFEENLGAVNQAQKFFAQASEEAKAKLKADFERGVARGTGTADEKREALGEAVVNQLKDFAPEVKERIKKAIEGGKLSEDDMQQIVDGNFAPLQNALGELGEQTLSQVLPALQKVKESEEQLFKIQKQRIDLENKYIEAQKKTIDVQMEAAKIMEEFGGAAVTPEMQKQAILDKANLDSAQAGVSGLQTGSAAEFAQRSAETRAKMEELGAVRKSAASGDRGAQQQINPEFEAQEQRLADLAAKEQETIRALIDVKRQELKLVKAKNKAEKDAIDSLLSGNIEEFLNKQAGAGAAAAAAVGDPRLTSQFGFTAFGEATKQLQAQKEAGVREVFGQNIDQVTENAYAAGLANTGMSGDLKGMAEVAAGTTAEEKAIQEEARGLAAQLVPAAQNQELAAKLQLDAARALEEAAKKQMEAAVQNVKERTGEAGKAAEGAEAPKADQPAAPPPEPKAQAQPEAQASKPAPSSPFSALLANVSGSPALQARLAANTNYTPPSQTGTTPPANVATTPAPPVTNVPQVPQNTSSSGASPQQMMPTFNSDGIISAIGGLQSVLSTIATNTTPANGNAQPPIDLAALSNFSQSLTTFLGAFQANIDRLSSLGLNITLAPVTVTVNLMDGGIFKAIKDYANNQIIEAVTKEISKYKVGQGGTLSKSSSTVGR
jgi:uncharacterized membrane protein